MNLEQNQFLKNFQSVVGAYQDVSAIYTKLFSQGQIQRLASLFNEIYDEEHIFTLTELRKYCQENNQKEDDFVTEQYELNSNIFRRNLTLIVQSLVEEVGKRFLERFRQDFSVRNPTEPEEIQDDNQESEKHQYKSNMPEIIEETEASIRIPTNSSTFRPKTHETENDEMNVSNKFELNISDLNNKVQHLSQSQPQLHSYSQPLPQPQPQPQAHPHPHPHPQHQVDHSAHNDAHHNTQAHYNSQPQQVQQYQSNSVHQQQPKKNKQKDHIAEALIRKAYATEPERDEDNNTSNQFVRYEEANRSSDYHYKYEGWQQIENETNNYKANLQKYYKTTTSPHSQFNSTHWSSPDRSRQLAQKNMSIPSSQKKSKAYSPGRLEGSSNSSFANNKSVSKFSSSTDRPDPSFLDSEFSYGQGKSFTKSPKKFHFDVPDVPGPGHYELEDSKRLVRPVTPDVTFSKTSKEPSYFKKSNVPGPIYYPIKHFSSK